MASTTKAREDRVYQAIAGEGKGYDLLRLGPVKAVFNSRLYPVVLQVIAAVVFGFIIFYGFFGPRMGEDNVAIVVTWRLWWEMLPFSFVLFGRLWCSICPIGASISLAHKVLPGRRALPSLFLRKYGVWIMAALFLGLFWTAMVRHICCWPKETAIFLVALLVAAVATAVFYRGHTWCRYLCPLGTFGGLLSMVAPLGLRPDRRACLTQCRVDKAQLLKQEYRECPMHELPMSLDTNRNCNLCARCVKSCRNSSMRLATKAPGREIWALRRPIRGEALFILALVAIAFVEVVQTTRIYPNYMKWAAARFPVSNYDFIFSISLLLLIGLVVAAYHLASSLSQASADEDADGEPIAFAYGYIPVVLGGYLGVPILRLAAHWKRSAEIGINGLSFGLNPFQVGPTVKGSHYSIDTPIVVVQILITLAGALLAMYSIRRIAKRQSAERPFAVALPHMVLAGLLAVGLLILFLQPAGVILH
ncbi:MAG: 4Fe-4S binding protein [Chloroflexi bacterium]|nr:4Fe-4S binding protein [Chloroflexota bacterium]